MILKDVIIVGAGPAGSSCARRLRQAGVDCLLLDKQTFPRFKPCAGWITPRVLTDLQLDPASYPHSFTTFRSFRISLRGLKFTIPTRQYAIRRIEFDNWLLKKAGVPVIHHEVREIIRTDDAFVVDGEYQARYIIGAGGTYCPVKKFLFSGSPNERVEDQIVGMEEEFLYDRVDEHCHLWFLENGLPGYSWYVPKSGGFVNVGVGAKARELKIKKDNIRRHWDLVTAQLERMGLVMGHTYQPVAHTYYLRHSPDKFRVGNAFLIGDSAGLATIDMGEGIGAAIRSGILAAESIITGRKYDLRSIPKFSFWSILTARKIST